MKNSRLFLRNLLGLTRFLTIIVVMEFRFGSARGTQILL